jgi:hypothetical protein
MGRACSMHGEKGDSCKNFGEKVRTLGRPRRRWSNNIKMNLRYMMGWYGLD